MKRDERKDVFFFSKTCLRSPNLLDELAQNVSNNFFSDFSFESSESYFVFNDLNSMFRAAGINSEKVSGGIAVEKYDGRQT